VAEARGSGAVPGPGSSPASLVSGGAGGLERSQAGVPGSDLDENIGIVVELHSDYGFIRWGEERLFLVGNCMAFKRQFDEPGDW
jgi:hypothetical protein